MKKFRLLLCPFVPIYRLVIWVRNRVFDFGILKSHSFQIPIINVGNIQTGGTGKTPTIEYLVNLLRNDYNIAILSRGYKRKTKGFRIAGENDTPRTIGDEAMQYFQKFEDVVVVVCEKRVKGVKKILKAKPDVNLILLDDAYQHRYIKPGLNILITDYFKPFFKDFLLPLGNLREPRKSSKRADIIVVTKTPRVYSPLVYRYLYGGIKLQKNQKFCMSYINYQQPIMLYDRNAITDPAILKKQNTILVFTGIGDPEPLVEYLKNMCSNVELIKYKDHHGYCEKDFIYIKDEFDRLMTRRKIIVTTEKDSVKLQNELAKKHLSKLPIYYIPIKFEFHGQNKSLFDDSIKSFLEENIKIN
ncbi:MAG: tetraacyldisaccharide 4'-kinase [Bacteroidales bacterium]